MAKANIEDYSKAKVRMGWFNEKIKEVHLLNINNNKAANGLNPLDPN